ncbi:hypothetical protein C8A01DRAFT_37707 [Parachaetomium inaequale]|uniref:Uncharacterized protein n=1 Tax=Parachaetomium inaequale TaxID=2588326 RepID=A0AAN6PGX1_9PEZI|nr:hypothetical protein C8A01DRAFT_37707 [Parachaetomium inaequale]
MADGSSTAREFCGGDDAEDLLDSLARALNAAGIPCVLWGKFLWQTHGVPTLWNALDLVVPDAKLAAASEVISKSKDLGFTLLACPDTTTCFHSEPNQTWEIPSFHLHIEGTEGRKDLEPRHRIPAAVTLFPQSETLWFLPQLDASLANPRANPLPRYLALASDTTALPTFVLDEIDMGRGVFKSDKTAVLVPRAHILTEALMRIMARDHGKDVGLFAGSAVGYMSFYVEKRGKLNIDLLPEPFGKLFRAYTSNDEKERMHMKEVLFRLMRAVGVPVEPEEYL